MPSSEIESPILHSARKAIRNVAGNVHNINKIVNNSCRKTFWPIHNSYCIEHFCGNMLSTNVANGIVAYFSQRHQMKIYFQNKKASGKKRNVNTEHQQCNT